MRPDALGDHGKMSVTFGACMDFFPDRLQELGLHFNESLRSHEVGASRLFFVDGNIELHAPRPRAHDEHTICDEDRLRNVMGDEEHGRAVELEQGLEFGLQSGEELAERMRAGRVRSRTLPTTRSSISAGTTRRPIAAGQDAACRPRRSGNSPPAAASPASAIPGATN